MLKSEILFCLTGNTTLAEFPQILWDSRQKTKNFYVLTKSHLLPPSEEISQGGPRGQIGNTGEGYPFLLHGEEVGCYIQTWQRKMTAH